MALGAFLIPYIFAVSPQLLLIGATPLNVVEMLLTSVTGMVALGAGVTGYWSTHLNWLERLALVAGGVLLVDPGWVTDVIGGVLVVAVFALQVTRSRRGAGAAAA